MRNKLLKIVAILILMAGMAVIASAKQAKPELSLTKTADQTTYDSVGQIINYNYTLNNTGDVALTIQFSVSDDKTSVTCPQPNSLAPGASIICTASYSVTQADLDNGKIKNTATATAYFNNNPVDSKKASVTINADTSKPAGNCPAYNGVGSAAPGIDPNKLAFTETGTTTRTISVITSNQNPGTPDIIPGVMMICKYPIVSGIASTQGVTGITAIFSGNEGLWATGIGCGNGDCARIGRANGNGNKNNIPMDGGTYVVGSVTFSPQPDSELIVAHINWPAECSPDTTCFRTLSSPKPPTPIPEFPTIALPIAGALGIMFLIVRSRKKANP